MRIAVDASVAVKWYLPEVHADAAARFRSDQFTLCAPDILGTEFSNAMRKWVRRGELSVAEAGAIVGAFAKLPIEYFPTKPLLASAFDIAIALDRTVYDSVYLALAVAQGCPLFTADRRFHTAVMIAPRLAAHIRWVEDQQLLIPQRLPHRLTRRVP